MELSSHTGSEWKTAGNDSCTLPVQSRQELRELVTPPLLSVSTTLSMQWDLLAPQVSVSLRKSNLTALKTIGSSPTTIVPSSPFLQLAESSSAELMTGKRHQGQSSAISSHRLLICKSSRHTIVQESKKYAFQEMIDI